MFFIFPHIVYFTPNSLFIITTSYYMVEQNKTFILQSVFEQESFVIFNIPLNYKLQIFWGSF
jgi:hypothetical protein